MKPLTIGKKKKGDAITKGAKIGSAVGGITGGLGSIGMAKRLGVGNKAALGLGAVQAVGGAVKGAIYGAGLGGLSTKVKKKKAKFNSDILTEFKKEINMVGKFPIEDIESKDTKKKKKSLIDEASDVVKNKDKMPDKNVPENIKTGSRTRILMK